MITRLLPALQRARHGLEIDFRLAGAGDAVEQRRREVAAVDRRAQRMHGRAPARSSNSVTRWCGSGSGGRFSGIATSTRLPEATSPSTTPEEHRPPAPAPPWRGSAPSPAISSARLRAGVMRGGSRRAFDKRHAEARLRRLEHGARAHHHAHHHAERRQRVLARSTRQSAADRRQRRHVEARGDGLSASWGRRACPARRTGLSQTTPMRLCGPNGTSTKQPGSSSRPSGTR